MSKYVRTKLLTEGNATFRCPNCSKLLIAHHEGNKYSLTFLCPRCKTTVKLECKEAPPLLINPEKFIAHSLSNTIKHLESAVDSKLVVKLREALTCAESLIPKRD